ncbi:hypothetical protein SAMN02745912_02642 [Paramaledivibacter caminithermalis DSM 15212]|jgi:hypothetical protein|uniref:Uncharacterized protein n=1 Tax=Paramaledivibacter caminithermalis (strain DSM 15212 / CIP 107654 / DViRD3) TaxID=1121301 RepID=A0A1M6QN37_PARC5|nr:hypothetical protein SAMN02745912_02642 [Paramaledivibacter caminithermalis DSM 15212]
MKNSKNIVRTFTLLLTVLRENWIFFLPKLSNIVIYVIKKITYDIILVVFILK